MRKVGGHVSISGGLINAVTNTLDIGGTCLQIFAGSPRLWFRKPFEQSQVKEFVDAVSQKDLQPVFIHALYLINLASPNPDQFEKSINSLVVDMENGAKIKSAGVIVHIGSHLGAGFVSVQDQVAAAIQRILAQTKDCDLLLENAAGQNGKIGSLEELSFLIKKISDPRLKICLDSAHLFESGVDLRQKEDVDKLVNYLKDSGLLEKLACLHLNDSATDLNSHRDMHANLGEGKIGIEGLENLVNHPLLKDLPLILETPGENHTGPDKKNIAIAKGLTK
jgi:deoxyribonuclease-4